MAAQGNNKSNGSATTSGRVDHPVGKAQWMDKEVTGGRVDHPLGKAQWMDKEVTDGRVDHPIGKVQWMDADDSGNNGGVVVTPPTPTLNRPSVSGSTRPSSQTTQTPEQKIKTDSVTITYSLAVLSYGRNKATADAILSDMSGGRTVTVPITFRYEQSGFSMAVNFAMRLKAIDARIEFKQQITKEIPLIISGM